MLVNPAVTAERARAPIRLSISVFSAERATAVTANPLSINSGTTRWAGYAARPGKKNLHVLYPLKS